MYKFVAIDLDGTMLNSYGTVTQYTKKVIKEKVNNGVEIVIASGRPIDSIKTISKEIGSENYFIAGNGALIYDIKKDEIKICDQNSISYNLYTEKNIIAKSLKYNVLYYHKENLKKEENKKTNINIVENVYEYVKNMNEEKFLKLTICDDNKTIFDSIIKKMRHIDGIEVLDVSHISRKIIKQGTEEFEIKYYYTEISLKNVDKWYAIKFLIEKLGIKEEEVIAIGDNINDKKMIQEAGLGIVMKGSTPVVTNVSDYVTDTNDNDGVAKALEILL